MATSVPEAEAVGPNAVRAGFNDHTLPRNDDQSTAQVPVGFPLNFFGQEYSNVYVNNNGNITFDDPMWIFTPFGLSGTQTKIIAPFFADVDTRAAGTDPVTYSYGASSVDGHDAFGVNWVNVGYFYQHADKLNSFQLVLIDRSDIRPGDFDIEFNYDQILWETGDASDGHNGLGGYSAVAGFSNGTGATYELPGSLVNGAFLDSNTQTGLVHNSMNSPQLGRYLFQVRNGTVNVAPSVTTHPENVTVTYGDNAASFTAEAVGSPAPTVQWQVSENNGASWNDIPGATSTTLTLDRPSFSQDGYQYRAVFSNGIEPPATSDAAVLTVNKRPIEVTADDQTKFLGAPDPELTYAITSGNLILGDTFSGGLTREPGESIGSYAIKQGTLTAGPNYEITFVGGTLGIVYNFSGFFSPVDNPGVVNTVKAGSAIPVKFSLGGDQGLDIFAAGYPASQRIPAIQGAEADAIEQTVTAGNSSLSYDQATDQYTYVWKTDKAWGANGGQTRELIVKLADGSEHTALFKFK
jgi:hypothetical protein